jgi:lipopolysaccharide export LptBFGC system permease protein LptF
MFRFSLKQWLSIFIIIGLILLGLWWWLKTSVFTPIRTENTTVMLEKMKTVTKLISVEGQFSELYDHKEEFEYDYFGLFSKKMILRVTATVSVGYDFEKMQMDIDSTNRSVTLRAMPKPSVLAIDHDLDYYDITEGTFNEFTPQEYNTISKKAKEKIATNPALTQLLAKAENQKTQYLSMMDIALKSAGWKLIVQEDFKPKM